MTARRLEDLAACSGLFEPWTGPFDRAVLEEWVQSELGRADALEEPAPRGPIHVLARAPRRILHVVSGNTPHAAVQSLLRGLTLGSHNTVKLPTGGLPPFEALVAGLPPALAELVTLVGELPADWASSFEAWIVFGEDDTIAWFTSRVGPHGRLHPHGQRLSIGLVDGDFGAAASLAARDIGLFDQRGCLSLHDVYVKAPPEEVRRFAASLALEMAAFEERDPRSPLTPSRSGAITTLRETVRFLAASQPEEVELWESPGGTAWTVVYESDPTLRVSCLDRVVFVKPWPEPAGEEIALGEARRHLATLAFHPYSLSRARELARLVPEASRLCPLGKTQEPTLFWHQDGLPPLASLVHWTDLG